MNQLNEIDQIMYEMFALVQGDKIHLENIKDLVDWVKHKAPQILDITNELRNEQDSEYPDGQLMLNAELDLVHG